MSYNTDITFGRILSVILGISGISVAAVFTSAIVNFYNEMSKKREEKEMQKLLNKVEEIEKKRKKKQRINIFFYCDTLVTVNQYNKSVLSEKEK